MNVTGSKYIDGQYWVWERWDIWELTKGIILFWNDAYDIDMLEEKLALLLYTPIIGLN